MLHILSILFFLTFVQAASQGHRATVSGVTDPSVGVNVVISSPMDIPESVLDRRTAPGFIQGAMNMLVRASAVSSDADSAATGDMTMVIVASTLAAFMTVFFAGVLFYVVRRFRISRARAVWDFVPSVELADTVLPAPGLSTPSASGISDVSGSFGERVGLLAANSESSEDVAIEFHKRRAGMGHRLGPLDLDEDVASFNLSGSPGVEMTVFDLQELRGALAQPQDNPFDDQYKARTPEDPFTDRHAVNARQTTVFDLLADSDDDEDLPPPLPPRLVTEGLSASHLSPAVARALRSPSSSSSPLRSASSEAAVAYAQVSDKPLPAVELAINEDIREDKALPAPPSPMLPGMTLAVLPPDDTESYSPTMWAFSGLLAAQQRSVDVEDSASQLENDRSSLVYSPVVSEADLPLETQQETPLDLDLESFHDPDDASEPEHVSEDESEAEVSSEPDPALPELQVNIVDAQSPDMPIEQTDEPTPEFELTYQPLVSETHTPLLSPPPSPPLSPVLPGISESFVTPRTPLRTLSMTSFDSSNAIFNIPAPLTLSPQTPSLVRPSPRRVSPQTPTFALSLNSPPLSHSHISPSPPASPSLSRSQSSVSQSEDSEDFATPSPSRLPTPPSSPLPARPRPLQLRGVPSRDTGAPMPEWSMRATDANALALVPLATMTSNHFPERPSSPVLARIISRPSSPLFRRHALVSPGGAPATLPGVSSSLAVPGSMYMSLPGAFDDDPEPQSISQMLAGDPPTPPLNTKELPVRARRAHAAPLPDMGVGVALVHQPQIMVARAVMQLVNVADPAWMLRVAIAVVGWFAVLATGTGAASSGVPAERRRARQLVPPTPGL